MDMDPEEMREQADELEERAAREVIEAEELRKAAEILEVDEEDDLDPPVIGLPDDVSDL